jgi:oxazoline/thiazoline synthase
LRAQGLEMLVLDQTRPDVGLPVVRVIVPGLRHFWARYAPGRLYDVPVKLGWLPAPRRENEMNPRAMFM